MAMSLVALFVLSAATSGGAVGIVHKVEHTISSLSNADSADTSRAAYRNRGIPEARLRQISGGSSSFWENFRGSISSIWGSGMPGITSSPAQDQQRCPVLKLPADFVMAAGRKSWLSMSGSWYTPSYVELANFDQSFLTSTLWYWNKLRMDVDIRMESSGQSAIRSKVYSDAALRVLYRWHVTAPSASNSSNASESKDSKDVTNIVLLDCAGTLMYVVRQLGCCNLTVYSREGSPLTTAYIETPVLKFQFADITSGYLIADAEAPGIGANVSEQDMPKDREYPILPFQIKFADGGYKGSSALMEPANRWVLAAAVQAWSIHHAEKDLVPWGAITLSWVIVIGLFVIVIGAIVAAAYLVFRLVWPHTDDMLTDHYGKISENPFLAVPMRPPHREELVAKSMRKWRGFDRMANM